MEFTSFAVLFMWCGNRVVIWFDNDRCRALWQNGTLRLRIMTTIMVLVFAIVYTAVVWFLTQLGVNAYLAFVRSYF